MTRRGTVIRHTIATSETIAKMAALTGGDSHLVIFIGLLLRSDDWGRFGYNPAKLAMEIPAFYKSPADIERTIKWLLSKDSAGEDGRPCLIKYKAIVKLKKGETRAVTVCQWANWEQHQKFLTSRDGAEWPNPKGKYELTTNPAAKARRDRAVAQRRSGGDQGKGKGKDQGKGKDKKHGAAPAKWAITLEGRVFKSEDYPDRDKTGRRNAAKSIERLTTRGRGGRKPYSTQKEVTEVLIWFRTSKHRDARFWNSRFTSVSWLYSKGEGDEPIRFIKLRNIYRDIKAGPTEGTVIDETR